MIYAAERAAAVCATVAKLKTTTGTIDAAAAGGMPDRQNSFTLDGHSYPLTSNSTTIDLKAALAAKRGRSVGDCYVVYGENPMNDEAAVEAPTGGEVTKAIFRVKVEGKTELIPASDASTVDELKAAVAAKIGRAVGGASYFVVAGKPLTGSTIRKLRAHGKKIELCSRVRGGGTIVQKVNAIAEQLELAKGPPAVVVQQANEMMGITPPAGATVMSQVEELMVQLNLAEAPKPAEESEAVPTRFMLFDELVAHGRLPRFGSEAGFKHPVTGEPNVNLCKPREAFDPAKTCFVFVSHR
jgi:hypothetical protein